MITGKYPSLRLRRNRKSNWSRKLIQENTLSPSDFILPIFLIDGSNKKESIKSMPNVYRYTINRLAQIIDKAIHKGIPMVALFPKTKNRLKDEIGSESLNKNNLVCKAIIEIKKRYKDQIGIMCDVALDPYTSHGHDGLIRSNQIINDETIEVLINQSLLQAEMGCDVLAPSDMMDGRIGKIRKALDKSGYQNVQILSYAAKYASSFYGPFRDAVGSKGSLITGSFRGIDNITNFNGWNELEDGGDNLQGISYEMFVMPLVKAVQELSKKVEEQQKEIEKLKKQ